MRPPPKASSRMSLFSFTRPSRTASSSAMGIDAADLLQRALERQIAFVPGEEFHVGGGGHNTLRLNFSNAAPLAIQEGIKRLGGLLRQFPGSA